MSEIRDQVYDCIVDYTQAQGLSPTIREIAERVGKSGTAVRWHLDKLEEEGRISRVKGRAGGIVVN